MWKYEMAEKNFFNSQLVPHFKRTLSYDRIRQLYLNKSYYIQDKTQQE